MERVGFQCRLLALLIDIVLVVIAMHPIILLDLMREERRNYNSFGFITAAGMIVLLFAYGLLDIFWQGTPGKRIMGLIIARDDGSRPTRGALVKRWAIKHSPIFFASWSVI